MPRSRTNAGLIDLLAVVCLALFPGGALLATSDNNPGIKKVVFEVGELTCGAGASILTLSGKAQVTAGSESSSAIVERLKSINESLPNRLVEPDSPEGVFLDSLPDKRPFSREALNQLVIMVDIKEKIQPTTEPPSLTAHSPCARALISARAESLAPIADRLKLGNLNHATRQILERLTTLIHQIIAGDERRKQRNTSTSTQTKGGDMSLGAKRGHVPSLQIPREKTGGLMELSRVVKPPVIANQNIRPGGRGGSSLL